MDPLGSKAVQSGKWQLGRSERTNSDDDDLRGLETLVSGVT